MKRILGILLLAAVTLVAIPLGFFLTVLAPQQPQSEFATNIGNIRKLQSLEAAWSLAALHAYNTPQSDFDHVASYLPQVREVRKALAESSLAAEDVPETLHNSLQRLLLLSEAKEEQIEHFKSNFAVVRNSLKYLPQASRELTEKLNELGNQEQATEIRDVYERTNAFLQAPDENTRARLLEELAEMESLVSQVPKQISTALGNFLAHAQVLVERKILLDSYLTRVADLDGSVAGNELLSVYKIYDGETQKWRHTELLRSYIFAVIAAFSLFAVAVAGALLLWRQRREFEIQFGQLAAEHADQLEQLGEEHADQLEQAAIEARRGVVDKNLNSSLAGVGNMAASVAHEINTPLGYLGSNLQVLHNGTGKLHLLMDEFSTLKQDLGGMEDSGQIKSRIENFSMFIKDIQEEAMLDELPEIVEDMQEGIEQIQHVINDLRDFTRKDRSDQDWFDINHCVDSALKMAQKEIPPDTKVQTSLNEVPKIHGSPAEINQVLINLINNAAHAVEHADVENPQIKIRTYEEKGHVLVSIVDNGIGMDEETRKKIFEPFFTTKDVGKGTGLGLAIVRRIINKHGGKVLFKSVPGKGTNFAFALPVEQTPEEQDKTTKEVDVVI